jgi:imidazolonepropionase-like amidohydrolase
MQILNQRRTTGALLLTALCATPIAAQDVLVQASKIVVAFGAGETKSTTLENSALLIRDGKIAFVGTDIPAEARRAARVIDYGSATISPGFVLAATTLGREVDLGEGAIAFTPDLRTAEAFDPWLEQLEQLAPAGVTAFGLMPSARNVAGGIGAIGKPGKERGRLLAPEVFVGFSVSRTARNQERQPTSLMGAHQMLRESFTEARDGVKVGPDLAVLRQVMAGQRPAFFYADTFAEINAVLEIGASFNFAPVILGAGESDRVLKKLATRGAGVVLNTLNPKMRRAELELPAKLTKAGIPFCFAGRPELLRMSAALAVRNGLSRSTASAALTRTPSTFLGQQANVGALRSGCGADFVVYQGDFLDLGARHIATWVDGKLAHGTAPKQTNKKTRTINSAGGR